MGDEATRLVGNVDPPELLGPSLVERRGFDQYSARRKRSEEVGAIAESDRHLAAFSHSRARSEARRTLDRGRVDAAMHDSPWGEVIRPQLQVAGDPGASDLIEDEPGGADEGAERFF